MGGINDFDNLTTNYKIPWRSKKWWRVLVLFFDILEVTLVNAFIIMQEYIDTHPGEIDRPSFLQKMIHENLACQLVGITDIDLPPLAPHSMKRKKTDKEDRITEHTAIDAGRRCNCLVC